jgi:phosphotriesterase-related protein
LGVYVEFDAVGADWASQSDMLDYTLALIEAGHADRILLSHDAGWYDPSQAGGQPKNGGIRGYTALSGQFLPALRARGVTDDLLHLLTVTNPARAFGLPAGH